MTSGSLGREVQKSLQFLHAGAAVAVPFNADVPHAALGRVWCCVFPSSEALFHGFSTEGEYMPRYPVYAVFYLLYRVTNV